MTVHGTGVTRVRKILIAIVGAAATAVVLVFVAVNGGHTWIEGGHTWIESITSSLSSMQSPTGGHTWIE